MKKIIFTFVLLMTVCTCFADVLPAPDIVEYTNGNITTYAVRGSIADMYAKYNALSKKEQYEFIEKSLKNTSELIPYYYSAFADEIYEIDEYFAVFSYLLGRMRSYQDSLMCKANDIGESLYLFPLSAPTTAEYMSRIDGKSFYKLTKQVYKWDRRNPERPSPYWICYNSKSVLLGNPEIEVLPMSEYKKMQKKAKKSMLKAAKKHLKD